MCSVTGGIIIQHDCRSIRLAGRERREVEGDGLVTLGWPPYEGSGLSTNGFIRTNGITLEIDPKGTQRQPWIFTPVPSVLAFTLMTSGAEKAQGLIPAWKPAVERQLQRLQRLQGAVGRAFNPSHGCITFLDSYTKPSTQQVVLPLLLENAPLPVLVYRVHVMRPPALTDCGGRNEVVHWGCGGVVVLAEDFNVAACVASTSTSLSASTSVLIVLTTGRPLSDARGDNDVKFLGTVQATMLLWSTGEIWYLSKPYLLTRSWLRGDGEALDDDDQRDNFNGRTLRVFTHHQPPISYVDDPTDPKKVFGTEWAVLSMMAQHLNFTWSLFLSESSDRWGKPADNSSWKGGSLGALVDGKVDVALNVWVQEDQSRIVDFTTFTRLSCLTFMVPRPRMLGANADAVLLSLQSTVWMLWLLSIGVAALACRLLDTVVSRVGVATDGSFRTLGRCLHTLLGSSVTSYIPASTPALGPHRHVLAWWVVFSVLMTTAFSSGLIAHLTFQPSEPPINTPRDIVNKCLSWASGFIPNFQVYLNMNIKEERVLADRLVLIRPANWERSIAQGKYVVYGQTLGTKYFFGDGEKLSDATLEKMRIMKTCLFKYPISFALHRGSPFLRPFSRVIARLKEGGLVDYWQRMVLAIRGRRAIRSLMLDEQTHRGPQVLRVSQLLSAFRLLMVGLALALFVFILEYVTQPSAHLRKEESFVRTGETRCRKSSRKHARSRQNTG